MKQSIPSSSGFTLTEFIVGSLVSLAVLSITLGVVIEQRRLFLGDQDKTNHNQNLRAASEYIGVDIKQVGGRVLNSTPLPIIRLLPGSTGTDPDTLILQRQLIADTLQICADVSSTTTEIIVANQNSGCHYSDGDVPPDNLTDSLGEFKAFRCNLNADKVNCDRGQDDAIAATLASEALCDSECLFAFIHDPINNRGEYFIYTDETVEGTVGSIINKLQVIPLGAGGSWNNSYSVASNPVIYILEEKRYGLCGDILQLTVNRRPDNGGCPFPATPPLPARLSNQIADLQFRVQTSTGWLTSFNTDLSNLSDWQDINSIEVRLETTPSDFINTDSNTLMLTTEFFPRNVLSDN